MFGRELRSWGYLKSLYKRERFGATPRFRSAHLSLSLGKTNHADVFKGDVVKTSQRGKRRRWPVNNIGAYFPSYPKMGVDHYLNRSLASSMVSYLFWVAVGRDVKENLPAWTNNRKCFKVNFPTLGIQSPCKMMSQGCPITETKRKVFRFHETIPRFGEPGSLGLGFHRIRWQFWRSLCVGGWGFLDHITNPPTSNKLHQRNLQVGPERICYKWMSSF